MCGRGMLHLVFVGQQWVSSSCCADFSCMLYTLAFIQQWFGCMWQRWEAAERHVSEALGVYRKYECMLALFFFLAFYSSTHQFVPLTYVSWPLAQLFDFFYLFCSPWRLCGPQPGPPSQFCPVDRSRLFSTRCLRSETCTKASIRAWRPSWAHTARLSPAQVRRERWTTKALSWWWETCSWKW